MIVVPTAIAAALASVCTDPCECGAPRSECVVDPVADHDAWAFREEHMMGVTTSLAVGTGVSAVITLTLMALMVRNDHDASRARVEGDFDSAYASMDRNSRLRIPTYFFTATTSALFVATIVAGVALAAHRSREPSRIGYGFAATQTFGGFVVRGRF